MDVYIGTYTDDSQSKGIYRCSFDSATGILGKATLAATAANPSFLARNSLSTVLYAASEVAQAEVISYRVLKDSLLEEADRISTGGSAACHVAVLPTGNLVFAANYGDGSVMSCPVSAEGMFERPAQTVRHTGKSVEPDRQEGPHAHSVNIDSKGETLLVADLGTDSIVAYSMGKERGELTEIGSARGSAIAGSGPRHLVFHPNGRVIYCLNELTSTVTIYEYTPGKALQAVQTVPGLPQDFMGVSTAADIHISQSATFLYSSNRGHDSIAVFRIDADCDLLPVGHISTGGKNPRNFTLVRDSPFLLAANQDSDNVVVFKIGDDGIPVATGASISIPKPVCLLQM